MYAAQVVWVFVLFQLVNAVYGGRAGDSLDDAFTADIEAHLQVGKEFVYAKGKEFVYAEGKAKATPKPTPKKTPKPKEPPKPPCPDIGKTQLLYRVIRSDENCERGLIAKDPHATKTISSHVTSGSGKNYKSQFISFTSSLDRANRIKGKAGNEGSSIVKVKTTDLGIGCEVYDLTKKDVREKNVPGATARNFALGWCEVVVHCVRSIPCEAV